MTNAVLLQGGFETRPNGLSVACEQNLAAPKEFAEIERAFTQLAKGRPILLTDYREGETDLVYAARHITPAKMAFVLRSCNGGVTCVACDGPTLDRLKIDLMVEDLPPGIPKGDTNFTISVDHITTSSGISASDRATTVQKMADETATAYEFRRPGHVFPLRAKDGGVLERPGHTEAAVDVAGGLAVITEVIGDDGEPIKDEEVVAFGRRHCVSIFTVEALVKYRHAIKL